MNDTSLDPQVLGLGGPWCVAGIALNTAGNQMNVPVEHAAGVWLHCPACWRELARQAHAKARVLRHLSKCHFRTVFHARVPNVDCPDHGELRVKEPWAEATVNFAVLMERLIIDVLQECAAMAGTCQLSRSSWDEAWNVMDRVVQRGQANNRLIPCEILALMQMASAHIGDILRSTTCRYGLQNNARSHLLRTQLKKSPPNRVNFRDGVRPDQGPPGA